MSSPVALEIDKKYIDNIFSNQFSLSKAIKAKAAQIIVSYLSHSNIGIKSWIVIPTEIQQLCSKYFLGRFPSVLFDDTLSKFSPNQRDKLIKNILTILCPGNKQDSLSKLLINMMEMIEIGFKMQFIATEPTTGAFARNSLYNYILVAANNPNTNITINCQFQNFRQNDIDIYFSSTYLSLLISCIEIVNIHHHLSKQHTTNNVFAHVLKDEHIISIQQRFSKYGEIDDCEVISVSNTPISLVFLAPFFCNSHFLEISM